LPRSRRCYLLGRSIAIAIRSWERDVRVAVITSGSLSLEIGGPRVEVNKTFGVPDPAWAAWVLDKIKVCDHATLIEQATERRMSMPQSMPGVIIRGIPASVFFGTFLTLFLRMFCMRIEF
jgi:hypothetical protein